jgi:hypothetical protein
MPQQDSQDVYLVKTVTWKDADVRIITQNGKSVMLQRKMTATEFTHFFFSLSFFKSFPLLI